MPSAASWRFGPFCLDATSGSLWRHEELLPLSPKPVAVLAYLVAHAGEVVTKEALLDAAWPQTAVTEGVLKNCLGQIRQALGDTAKASQWIATVHRRGYRFIAPVTVGELPPLASAESASLSLPTDASGLEAQTTAGLPPLMVAREAELAQLQQWWTQALQGERQVVFLTGEAGLGKTTLMEALVAHVGATASVWLGRGQCIEQYGVGEAYLPLLEALGRLGRGPEGGPLLTLLRQQAPSWLVQLPALVPADEYEALLQRAGATTGERMLRELAEAVEVGIAERPLLLVLEDLHWSDSATLVWLAYVARRRGAARLMVVGTYRPVDAIMQAHSVHTLTQELQRQGQCRKLALPSLSEAGIATYLERRFQARELSHGLAQVLYQRTEGNPLFLVTMVDELVRQGTVQERGAGWEVRADLDTITVGMPESLRQLLAQQVEQLPPDERMLLEAASVAGMEFAAAAVAAGVAQAVEDVEACCDALARRGHLLQAYGTTVWPDGTVTARYGFQHALYQEVFYHRVPVSRQARWHGQIGARLEAAHGERAHEIAAELAVHFVRGRVDAKAVQYSRHAGENALRRSAHQEAGAHLTKGLELLEALPDTPERVQQELDMLIALRQAFAATKGMAAAEVEYVHTRAYALCQQRPESPQLPAVLTSLWSFHLLRAELPTAREVAEQLLSLAQRRLDAAGLLEAHYALGVTLYFIGAFAPARAHLERGIALYNPQQHTDPRTTYGARNLGVSCRAFMARTLGVLGYPEQACQENHAALTLARELAQPYSLVLALIAAATLYRHLREAQTVHKWASELMALATEQGFAPDLAHGTIFRGSALAMQGQVDAGIAQMRQGLTAFRARGQEAAVPSYLAMLAEAYGQAGQIDEGLVVLAEALEAVDTTGERFYEAELYRLQGELLLAATAANHAEVETCFQRALAIARSQQARCWELHTAMSLSRLWRQQGKRAEARELLAEVYNGFTEGFETMDLQEAKALLEALRD